LSFCSNSSASLGSEQYVYRRRGSKYSLIRRKFCDCSGQAELAAKAL
jgi:hypothetical protein